MILVLFFITAAFCKLVPISLSGSFVVILNTKLLPSKEVDPLLRGHLSETVQFFERRARRARGQPYQVVIDKKRNISRPFSRTCTVGHCLVTGNVPRRLVVRRSGSIGACRGLLCSGNVVSACGRGCGYLFVAGGFRAIHDDLCTRQIKLSASNLNT